MVDIKYPMAFLALKVMMMTEFCILIARFPGGQGDGLDPIGLVQQLDRAINRSDAGTGHGFTDLNVNFRHGQWSGCRFDNIKHKRTLARLTLSRKCIVMLTGHLGIEYLERR